ncbi:cytochrome P450 [Rhizoctonia solani AG-1 IA]|uniref:Cytochrome P450 n=1 Tax=Thanatephorus cucumeris (strain AG1-IA) TaxID=983506 RepID=L8WNW5_THACA|nr:cytochrome P450 [Rhizoctonia solani AG-1 IA]
MVLRTFGKHMLLHSVQMTTWCASRNLLAIGLIRDTICAKLTLGQELSTPYLSSMQRPWKMRFDRSRFTQLMMIPQVPKDQYFWLENYFSTARPSLTTSPVQRTIKDPCTELHEMDYLADLTDQLTLKHLFCIACGIAVIKLGHCILRPIRNWRSPLRNLQGPESNNLIFGHLEMLQEAQTGDIWEQWIDKYGKTFRWRRFFGVRASRGGSVMSRDTMFPKSRRLRVALARILGEGASPASYHESIFQYTAYPQPGAYLLGQVKPGEPIRNKPDGETIDVLLGTTCATLDIIGIAGFGYEFHSLEGKDEDELAKAFMSVFNSNDKKPSSIGLLFMIISHRLGIVSRIKYIRHELTEVYSLPKYLSWPAKGPELSDSIRRIGMEIVEDKKKILYQNQGGDEFYGRDLLTLLIKSNIAPDIEKDQAMTDEEIFGPAGHETTSSTTSWALYALTKHPEVQTKLRQELLKAGLGDEPSMEELEKISYLDNFVREVLRVHAVVPLTSREADCDTVIPVGESYIDIHGNIQHGIRWVVQKGDSISIPILAMNRAKDVWGEDALDFKPERWDNLPDGVKDMFIHGPNACIGYRFAVIEVKALLYSLVRAFEFNIDPNLEIVGKTMLVSRPCVKGDSDNVNKMPLICKPVARQG